jgi:hypothetical protein
MAAGGGLRVEAERSVDAVAHVNARHEITALFLLHPLPATLCLCPIPSALFPLAHSGKVVEQSDAGEEQ